ncbi:MAG: phosphoglucosamine mutase [Holophagaceae bacterium]|nr:phosphoglucosamine mutase [Holophagaceae bacterium]
MSLRYFGTDGIRGKALQPPLTLDDAARWGRAFAEVAAGKGIETLVLGWDPRLSSPPLARAFVAGLGRLVRAEVLGMVPTPAVAWATARRDRAWGVMISASHNPPEDNGIKGFNGLGEKLAQDEEEAIEAAYAHGTWAETMPAELDVDAAPVEAYLAHLGHLELPADLPVVADCAHGATAPWACRVLGGAVHWIGVPAEGARINVGVGSTHLEALQAEVRRTGAALGLAFDGDGDRCLFVDGTGRLVDGDQMLWLLALDRLEAGDPAPGVVGTVMSNGGLAAALAARNIPFERTPVGDKHLLRRMGELGWDLAAEASGHVIQKRLGPSGDGLATALSVLKALLHRPAERRWDWRFEAWPLRLVNLVAPARRPLEDCPALQSALRDLEAAHGADLRLVVRWSGTEPKLRLMGEAKDAALLVAALDRLHAAAARDLGLTLGPAGQLGQVPSC